MHGLWQRHLELSGRDHVQELPRLRELWPGFRLCVKREDGDLRRLHNRPQSSDFRQLPYLRVHRDDQYNRLGQRAHL